uniref:U2A'/phosphoprotein 32 family A C-terminal domain-containing protein n=1 Tax=Globisporangium ultimum (strain ATCC 200006 / CBS 805.95 / DAOM BR144) TaxID=431595 RepID=K3WUR8_GLOUD
MARAGRGDVKALQLRVLDGEALKLLCTEPNSSKFAIDAHNRSVEEIGDLSELPKLCSLDLSFNRLTNLKNLATAKELRELKLYNNKLTITSGLRANSNLEGLFLSENQIGGISADFLALVKLKSLWLKGNRIECVENLKSCRLLVRLDLSRNRLAGPASEGLETLISLESLNLSDNQITAIGNLSQLTKLEELNVGNNRLSTLEGQFPPNVTALRVNGNRISDLQSLAGTLAKLNELYIQDNAISNLEPIVSRFPELESLDVRNNRIRSAAQFSALSAYKTLQDIWLIGNPCCLSISYLVDIFTALPELKTLDNLTDVQLQSHVEGLKNGTISPHAGVSTPRPQTPLADSILAAWKQQWGRLSTDDTERSTRNARLGCSCFLSTVYTHR